MYNYLSVKNRVQLTDTGRLFQVEAQEMVKQWELSIERIRLASKGIQEKVMIAMTPLMVETILPHVIYQFINDNPSIEISILVEDSAKIEDLVNQDQAHIGISLLPTRYRHWHQELLIDSPLELVIPLMPMMMKQARILIMRSYFKRILYLRTIIQQFGESYYVNYEKICFNEASIHFSILCGEKANKGWFRVVVLPRMIVRKERMEGRFNIVPFEDFPLPSVPVYLFYKESTQVPDGLVDLLQTRNYL